MSTKYKISQAVGYVVCENRKFKVRISRSHFSTLVHYWQNYKDFKYIKIYEIKNYKKGTNHTLGNKIAYITRTRSLLTPSGIFETQKSIDFKKQFIDKKGLL